MEVKGQEQDKWRVAYNLLLGCTLLSLANHVSPSSPLYFLGACSGGGFFYAEEGAWGEMWNCVIVKSIFL